MRIVSTGRQCGKTTELIRMAVGHSECVIVCPTRERAEGVAWAARKMGVNITKPVTWAEFISGTPARGRHVEYLIDDLDDCLSRYGAVVAASVTGVSVDVHQVPAG
jgi:hypothetical protein